MWKIGAGGTIVALYRNAPREGTVGMVYTKTYKYSSNTKRMHFIFIEHQSNYANGKGGYFYQTLNIKDSDSLLDYRESSGPPSRELVVRCTSQLFTVSDIDEDSAGSTNPAAPVHVKKEVSDPKDAETPKKNKKQTVQVQFIKLRN